MFRIGLIGLCCLTAVLPVGGQVPGSELKVEAIWSLGQAGPGDQRVLGIVVEIAPGYHINPDKQQVRSEDGFKPWPTTVHVKPAEGLKIGPVVYPPPVELEVQYADGSLPVYEGRTVFFLPVLVDSDATPGRIQLTLGIEYQACTQTQCLQPVTVRLSAPLDIVGPKVLLPGPTDPQLFADFDWSVFATMASGARGQGTEGPRGRGADSGSEVDFYFFKLRVSGWLTFAVFLLMAALGGLLLNFTPCVLPMIPLKIMGLAHSAHNRGRCLALGVTMTGGIVTFWLIIGTLIAGLSSFRAINQLFQYPAFTIAVGVFIALMAVGMCGRFAFTLPQFVYALSPRQDSHVGSFGFGVMTAVLATPCTAPFMGSAAAWATMQQAPGVVLGTFAAIGVGMALPYLLLAAMPHWIDKLPRSGPGSELLKEVMGLLMLAAASYFVGVGILSLQADGTGPPSQLYWIPVAICLGGGGIWLTYRTFRLKWATGKRLVIGSLGVALIFAAGAVWPRAEESPLWVYYTPQRYADALEQGNIVVLDFTAEWCLNCKLLEQTVLSTKGVVELLHSPGVVAMKVDLTGNNPDGAAMLGQTGRVAIPLLVVISPDGQELFKSHIYTAEQLVEVVRGQ